MRQPELKICNGKDETQLDIALSGHKYHCPNCDIHLTSIGLCPRCGVRFVIPTTCSYFDCKEDVCEHDVNYPPPSMRFCQKHSEEINGYIERQEIPKILGFWIKANGGAKRMAEKF